jgi:hypothetical protein
MAVWYSWLQQLADFEALKHTLPRLVERCGQTFACHARYNAIAGRCISWGRAFRGPMRWLMILMAVSVVALLAVSGGMALHIWRQHKSLSGTLETPVQEESDVESEEAP